jgi:hypothetical protein
MIEDAEIEIKISREVRLIMRFFKRITWIVGKNDERIDVTLMKWKFFKNICKYFYNTKERIFKK